MATSTNGTKGFFAGVEAVEPRGGFEILPVTTATGAPRDQKWLVQIVEDSVEVRHSGDFAKTPGHPYLAYSLAIVEPEEYANRRVFGMFYFAPDAPEDASPDDQTKVSESRGKVKYQIDAILGEGTFDSIFATDLEDAMEQLCPMLEEVYTVAVIGKESGKKGTPYEGEVKNKVLNFLPGDSWVNEDAA